jgi:1,2-diacylglycerol 3-alpha-glucosyltransferase
MKILFVSDTYYPHLNGVYYFVCRLAPLLQEKGHQVAVIAPSETMGASRKKIDQIDVYGVPSLPVIYYPKVRFTIPVFQKRRIKAIVEEFKPDVIHVQDHFPLAQAAISVGNALGVPVMGTNHFMTENLTAFIRSEKWKKIVSDLLWKKFTKVYNRVALVTTPSEWAADLIRPKLDVPIISISSGINLKEFMPYGNGNGMREKFGIPDKPVLLFVGRLDPEKKISETLRAVALALLKMDFCFVIVGKGIKKEALKEQARKLRIADHVIFTGFVSNADLPDIYRLSNCFIISSTAELLSLGTLQGMAAGLPIIAVEAGALGELVRTGENGYLYKTGDIISMAECICSVLGKPALQQKMREKSAEFVLEHDIYQTTASFERAYQRMLKPEGRMSVIKGKKPIYKMA